VLKPNTPADFDVVALAPRRVPFATYPIHPMACARLISDLAVFTVETSGLALADVLCRSGLDALLTDYRIEGKPWPHYRNELPARRLGNNMFSRRFDEGCPHRTHGGAAASAPAAWARRCGTEHGRGRR